MLRRPWILRKELPDLLYLAIRIEDSLCNYNRLRIFSCIVELQNIQLCHSPPDVIKDITDRGIFSVQGSYNFCKSDKRNLQHSPFPQMLYKLIKKQVYITKRGIQPIS